MAPTTRPALRRLVRSWSLCLAVWIPVGAAAAQDPAGGDDPPRPPVVVVPGAQKPLLAVDGEPALAGRVPKGTDPVAVERWQRFERSTWTAGEAPPPMRSFVVGFDLSVRERENGPRKDTTVQFWFLDEGRGYVKGVFPDTDRVSMRGPEGDWLVDGKERVDLSDHSNLESRREHERWLTVARNFATLASPGGLRPVALRPVTLGEPLADDPLVLRLSTGDLLALPDPKTLAQARGLDWLEVDSPDFALQLEEERAPGQRLYRALLGLDRSNGEVRVTRLVELNAGTPHRPGSLLVRTPRWVEVDGRRVPEQMLVHRRAPETPQRFESDPGIDLWIVRRQTHLKERLRPEDFVPAR